MEENTTIAVTRTLVTIRTGTILDILYRQCLHQLVV